MQLFHSTFRKYHQDFSSNQEFKVKIGHFCIWSLLGNFSNNNLLCSTVVYILLKLPLLLALMNSLEYYKLLFFATFCRIQLLHCIIYPLYHLLTVDLIDRYVDSLLIGLNGILLTDFWKSTIGSEMCTISFSWFALYPEYKKIYLFLYLVTFHSQNIVCVNYSSQTRELVAY